MAKPTSYLTVSYCIVDPDTTYYQFKLEHMACYISLPVYISATGIEDIDNAFAGSMTYQPAVPSKDLEMLVSIFTRSSILFI